ncbi:MAG: GGDEF domain-containing protein [Oscillospiraceae bacterium]|nr:GGDEF domain-containing protein [Oscillospiraceae bacterium]
MDFQALADSFCSAASIVSVEKLENGNYGKICIVTGNRPYLDTIEHPMPGVEMKTTKFIPGSEYTTYMPPDLNFEGSCYTAAVGKKTIHAYAHPERYNVWFNMSFIPLMHEDGNICYCIYTVEVDFKPDARRMSTISSDIAASVLETCIKLRSHGDFRETMNVVCRDILDLCGSDHCCIISLDTAKRKCSVLCEAHSVVLEHGTISDMIDDSFFDMAYSWLDTIAGSNCILVRNDRDMEALKERNPEWYHSMKSKGTRNIVLFPLKFNQELLGYIWTLNFREEDADRIKETLELTTFILASEIYSYRMMDELNILSTTDMLTGVSNRNAMNNYVSDLVESTDSAVKEKTVSVVFADLNGLKRANDNEGHAAGDLLLKKAALVLQKSFTGSNIYRAGGDEFVVVSENISESELAERLSELRAATSKPEDEVCFAVGSSIGKAGDIRRLMQEADSRMYADKVNFYKLHPELKRN